MGDETIILKLEGVRSDHGLSLASFESFVQNFRRALTDFDRQRRGEPTKRSGAPNVREELVAAFRIVGLHPGSTVVTLEPIIPDEIEGQEQIPNDAEPLPLENLRSLLDTVENDEDSIDPSVTDSLAEARRALGADGRIVVDLPQYRERRRKRRRVVIDADRIRQLEARASRPSPRPLQVMGRLHRIELEPDRVGIRAPIGVDWKCTYPEPLEETVKALLDSIVIADGVGYQSTAQRGQLTIESIRALPRFEQTELFTLQSVPLDDILREAEPRLGMTSVLPEDITDEELDAFVGAVEAL